MKPYGTKWMTSAKIASPYVALEFRIEVIVGVLRKTYQDNFPGKEYGQPERNILIIARDDLLFLKEYMSGLSEESSFSTSLENTYRLYPVFLGSDTPQELKNIFRAYFPYAVAEVCKVCNRLMFSGAHKHILSYCKICDRETKHVTSFFGYPFTCSEKHPYDKEAKQGLATDDEVAPGITLTDKSRKGIDLED